MLCYTKIEEVFISNGKKILLEDVSISVNRITNFLHIELNKFINNNISDTIIDSVSDNKIISLTVNNKKSIDFIKSFFKKLFISDLYEIKYEKINNKYIEQYLINIYLLDYKKVAKSLMVRNLKSLNQTFNFYTGIENELFYIILPSQNQNVFDNLINKIENPGRLGLSILDYRGEKNNFKKHYKSNNIVPLGESFFNNYSFIQYFDKFSNHDGYIFVRLSPILFEKLKIMSRSHLGTRFFFECDNIIYESLDLKPNNLLREEILLAYFEDNNQAADLYKKLRIKTIPELDIIKIENIKNKNSNFLLTFILFIFIICLALYFLFEKRKWILLSSYISNLLLLIILLSNQFDIEMFMLLISIILNIFIFSYTSKKKVSYGYITHFSLIPFYIFLENLFLINNHVTLSIFCKINYYNIIWSLSFYFFFLIFKKTNNNIDNFDF